jgi:hypothetical protein
MHPSNQALVVAHFHQDGQLRSDTLNFLEACQGSFKRLIFVSKNLSEAQISRINLLNYQVLFEFKDFSDQEEAYGQYFENSTSSLGIDQANFDIKLYTP